MHKMKRYLYVLLLAVCCYSNIATAGIITYNGYTHDENTDYFSNSTLQWLQLDINGTYHVTNNTTTDTKNGYRIANSTEVMSLFDDFVGSGPNLDSDAEAFFKMLGKVYNYQDGVDNILSFSYLAVSHDWLLRDDVYFLKNGSSIRGVASSTAYNPVRSTPDIRDDFLWVKDAGVNNVPEPATLAIFALGMIGLASRRFKKQS
ncbi:MAG: hypothetical protein ACI9LM_000530 [Alteromonadaceae bacterium]|jgi:hypothetical protein